MQSQEIFCVNCRCRGGAEFKQAKLGGVNFFKNERTVGGAAHLHFSPGAMTVVTVVWLHVNRCGNRCVVAPAQKC